MSEMHERGRDLLPLRRMAARLGVPSRWLREQAQAGLVPGLKAGDRWLFDPEVATPAVRSMASGDEVLSKSIAVSLERFGINASDPSSDAGVTVCINGATDSPFVQWLKEKGFKVVNNPSGLDQIGGAS